MYLLIIIGLWSLIKKYYFSVNILLIKKLINLANINEPTNIRNNNFNESVEYKSTKYDNDINNKKNQKKRNRKKIAQSSSSNSFHGMNFTKKNDSK